MHVEIVLVNLMLSTELIFQRMTGVETCRHVSLRTDLCFITWCCRRGWWSHSVRGHYPKSGIKWHAPYWFKILLFSYSEIRYMAWLMRNCPSRTRAPSFWCWMQKHLKNWAGLRYLSTFRMDSMGLSKIDSEALLKSPNVKQDYQAVPE